MSISSQACLIFSHFLFELPTYQVSTALFGFIVSEELFTCMKTSLGNASIGSMLYSGVFLPSLFEDIFTLRYCTLKFSWACFDLLICLFFTSSLYQNEVFKKCQPCVPSSSSASGKLHVKINYLFPAANKYLASFCEETAYIACKKKKDSNAVNRRFLELGTYALVSYFKWYMETLNKLLHLLSDLSGWMMQ